MKYARYAIFAVLVLAQQTYGQTYNTLADASYSHQEADGWYDVKYDSLSLSYNYYFDGKTSLGPLDQFEYINHSSYISVDAAYERVDYDNWWDTDNYSSAAVGGSYCWTQFQAGGGVGIDYDDSDTLYSVSAAASYLPFEDLKFSVSGLKIEDIPEIFVFGAQYNYQLNAVDYLGVTVETDDEFEATTLSLKYFKAFANKTYWVLSGSYTDGGYWSVGTDYYFNPKTSVGVSYDDAETLSVLGKYFYSDHQAIRLAYTDFEEDSYMISLSWVLQY